ncbi:hypothetical protein EJ04DRAFT_578812 [Polyplosphaeria fusca]|uniref:Extracellular membrane protein CFEM domain-containing protein n=1 Tax=Polyplosphaeria fusca TaxID=682080 RepID=A0A9P4QVT2_9PLEO|nr:hypothetical protein EJ04DRAFT_578812 [Polyplosphaeria fusca]
MYWHQLSLLALTTFAHAHIWDWPPYSDDDWKSTSSKHHHHHSSKYSSSSVESSTYSSTSSSSSSSSSTHISSTAEPTQTSSSSSSHSSHSSSSSLTTDMPTTTRITLFSTVTSFIALSSASPQGDRFGPIRGLPPCAQDVVIPALEGACSNEAIVTTNCICDNIGRLRGAVFDSCRGRASDITEFDRFVGNFCPSQRLPLVTIATSAPAPLLPTGTGAPLPANNSTIGPFNNGTVAPVGPASTEAPLSFTTSTILIPTTGPNGEPTTIPSETVLPLGGNPEPTGPATPPFEGEAPALGFGSVRAAVMGGAIGLMGLVFAEL